MGLSTQSWTIEMQTRFRNHACTENHYLQNGISTRMLNTLGGDGMGAALSTPGFDQSAHHTNQPNQPSWLNHQSSEKQLGARSKSARLSSCKQTNAVANIT